MRTLLRTARRLLAIATILYCAGLLVLALLWTIGFQGVWWLELANIFAPHLFAPLLLLAPAAILSHSRWQQIAVLTACAVFLGLFGPRMIPRMAQAVSGPRIRVATFNLHSSFAEPQVAEIIAVIHAQQADVYLFQELSAPAAAAIQQHLARDYPYQALVPSAGSTGMGLISRYPLDRQPRQNAPMQTALLRVGDHSITLINASLIRPEIKRRYLPGVGWVQGLGGYHTGKRSRQIVQLLRAIDDVQGPLVVGGDFNLSDCEPDYARMAARLHDAYAETSSGFGFTFPNGLRARQLPIPSPLIRIAYVWSAGGVVPAATAISCGSASDHCMVIADLRL